MEFRELIRQSIDSYTQGDPLREMDEKPQQLAGFLRDHEITENASKANEAQTDDSGMLAAAPELDMQNGTPADPDPAGLPSPVPASFDLPDVQSVALLTEPDIGEHSKLLVPTSQDELSEPPHFSMIAVKGALRGPSPADLQRVQLQKAEFENFPEVQALLEEEGTQIETFVQEDKVTTTYIPPGIDSDAFNTMIDRISKSVDLPDIVIGNPEDMPALKEPPALRSTSDESYEAISNIQQSFSKMERWL